MVKTRNSLCPEHVELLYVVAEEHGVSVETEGTSKASAKTVLWQRLYDPSPAFRWICTVLIGLEVCCSTIV